jgi:hypothetical protein
LAVRKVSTFRMECRLGSLACTREMYLTTTRLQRHRHGRRLGSRLLCPRLRVPHPTRMDEFPASKLL